MSVREQDNPALYAKIQEQNLLRRYDLFSDCIEIGLEKGIEAFDKHTKYTRWPVTVQQISRPSPSSPRGISQRPTLEIPETRLSPNP